MRATADGRAGARRGHRRPRLVPRPGRVRPARRGGVARPSWSTTSSSSGPSSMPKWRAVGGTVDLREAPRRAVPPDGRRPAVAAAVVEAVSRLGSRVLVAQAGPVVVGRGAGGRAAGGGRGVPRPRLSGRRRPGPPRPARRPGRRPGRSPPGAPCRWPGAVASRPWTGRGCRSRWRPCASTVTRPVPVETARQVRSALEAEAIAVRRLRRDAGRRPDDPDG